MSAMLDVGIFARRRVRHVRQTETSECGLACLAMVAGYHGLQIDLATLRSRFAPSTRGMPLRSVMSSADRLGFATRAVKVGINSLKKLRLPAILHWNMKHYVVLEAVSRSRLLIHDPAGTSVWTTLGEVSDHFTGVALELEPTMGFERGEQRQRLNLSTLWSRVYGFKRAVLQTVILSAVIQAFTLAAPYYLQLIVDSALPELNLGFATVLAIGFGLFAVLNGVASALRQSVLLAVGSSFGYGLSSNVARRLFRLPVDWFSKRHVGDVLARFQSVMPIRKMLAEDAPATLVDGVLAVATLVLMFFYSPLLSSMAMLALAAYAALRTAMFAAQRRAQEEVIVSTAREQSVLIESVQGIRALRLAGREALRHALWQSKMTDAVNGTIRYQRLANWQTTIQTTLFAVENVASIWVATSLVIRGGFSVGMVFAFLAYKTQFLAAGASLIVKSTDYRMLGLHLDRLSDIALAQEDVGFRQTSLSSNDLIGAIELRDVRFRYGMDDPLILRGVNLRVEAGQSIAITGPSGGGKTTLLNVLLGLMEPSSGEVVVDGVPLHQFGHRNFFRSVAAVLQDDTLFGGSIGENISLFDDDPDPSLIREAAQAAAIHEDVMSMPMRYDTLVGEMGASLSGGQKQRVLLARALYRRPRLLVMDEGTSHLDEARERQVNAAIKTMGVTRIIVAHRRETIDSAERVFSLVDGILTEM